MGPANVSKFRSTTTSDLPDTHPQSLGSIAIEELSLANIMNAEEEKIQFILGTLTPTNTPLTPSSITLSNLFYTSLTPTMVTLSNICTIPRSIYSNYK
ncbi:hypothetical protein [Risungbinella massiliensis]|uniref:hypothetical protein n=1 Tax=Risungbinella massiliensis TaxID=1329796 RepID=UPI00069B6753|nr:hypothetical protein [Risungbinella massiliensis]